MGAVCARHLRQQLLLRDEPAGPAMHLPGWMLFAYVVPLTTVDCAGFLMTVFAMKFCTDTLLIGPGAMGTIFSISRLMDSVTDPLIGHLSDRTTLAFGRRRSWCAP